MSALSGRPAGPSETNHVGHFSSPRPLPPCRHQCPAHVDIPGYLAQIAAGHADKAVALIRRSNPFPAVCAYVCQHPCEAQCNRRFIDAAVNIRGLKQWAVTHSDTQAEVFAAASDSGNYIAVIGAGPAGLTAAYFLSRFGHLVTIFESQSLPGGMLRYGIPTFRLPRNELDRDIAFICRSDRLRMELNHPVTDADYDQLLRDYDAVLVTTGTPNAKRLALPGLDAAVTGLAFLNPDTASAESLTGKNVIVIGGGNTAIDCARTALRRQAARVTLCCRRDEAHLRADPDEVRQAKEEGVELLDRTVPLKGDTNEEGRLTGLLVQRADTDAPVTLHADLIIEAVGQTAAPVPPVTDPELAAKRFFAGDGRPGQTAFSVIDAVADGRKAAQTIHRFLSFTETPAALPITAPKTPSSAPRPLPCAVIPIRPADERRHDHQSVETAFSDADAVREAVRCLHCDTVGTTDGAVTLYPDDEHCSGCRACVNVCPQNAVKFVPNAEGHLYPKVDASRCTRCGLCRSACGFQSPVKHTEKLAVYGMLTKDATLLKKSSSGGIFAELAREVLAQHGVVFGAALASGDSKHRGLHVRHRFIETLDELPLLQGSKYAPSDIDFTYRQAKDFLDAGRLVFFTGVPCQIAGLLNFLQCFRSARYPNLLTAAILCHGTPHPAAFPDYIQSQEATFRLTATDFNFRQNHNVAGRKFYDWGLTGYASDSAQPMTKTLAPGRDPYGHLFFGGFLNRASCYRCRYCSDDRPEDITLGDFWGIEKEHPELFAPGAENPFRTAAAVSCVAVNTPQGEAWIRRIRDRVDAFETTFEKIARYNQLHQGMVRGRPDEKLRERFAVEGYPAVLRHWQKARLRHWLLAVPRRLLPSCVKERLKRWLKR